MQILAKLPSTTPTRRKKNVLVIDDNPASSRMVRLVLEKSGAFEILELNDPSRAIGSAALFKPDLVLLDVEMPERDGGDVARDFRNHPNLKDIPIVFMTSLVTEEEAVNPIFTDGVRVMAKPVTLTKLAKCVGEVLGLQLTELAQSESTAAPRRQGSPVNRPVGGP